MYNIFVGNLAFTATRDDVQKLFASFGTVTHVMIMEKKKKKSRGFCFVAMPNEEERNKAMEALSGREFMGRQLVIAPFVPKGKDKPKSRKFRGVQHQTPRPPTPRPTAVSSRPTTTRPPHKTSYAGSKPTGKPYYRKDDRETTTPWAKLSQSQSYRKDDRSSKPAGESGVKPERKSYSSKAPYKKFDGSSKPARPSGKQGGAFKMFYGAGKPAKPRTADKPKFRPKP